LLVVILFEANIEHLIEHNVMQPQGSEGMWTAALSFAGNVLNSLPPLDQDQTVKFQPTYEFSSSTSAL
jgi:hypothetical protein